MRNRSAGTELCAPARAQGADPEQGRMTDPPSVPSQPRALRSAEERAAGESCFKRPISPRSAPSSRACGPSIGGSVPDFDPLLPAHEGRSLESRALVGRNAPAHRRRTP